MFDNRKAPHVHNKSVMCNFIFIQSILLSHCELNTFSFYKGCLIFHIIKGKLLGIKAASLSTSFASLQHVKKACDFWDAASWFEWILLCSKLKSRHSFILNLVFVWMLVEIQGIGWSWFWEQPRAWWSVLGYKTIKSSSPCLSLSLSCFCLQTFPPFLSPRVFHRQRKHRSRKHHHHDNRFSRPGVSHHAPCHKEQSFRETPPISQRYKQILQLSSSTHPPLPPTRVPPSVFSRKTSQTQPRLQEITLMFRFFFPFLWHININWSIRQFLI